MRPGRLSEIFDGAENTTFALDQQNVTGSKRVAQGRRIVRSERLAVARRLLQRGNQTSDNVEHPAHGPSSPFSVPPCGSFQMARLPFGSYAPNLVMERRTRPLYGGSIRTSISVEKMLPRSRSA